MSANNDKVIIHYFRNLLICCFFWILMFFEIKYQIFLQHIPNAILLFLSPGLFVLPVATFYNLSIFTSELCKKTDNINFNLILFSLSAICSPLLVILFCLLVSTSEIENILDYLNSKEFFWDGFIVYNIIIVISFFFLSKQSSLLNWYNSNIFVWFIATFWPAKDDYNGWECNDEFLDESWEFFDCNGIELNYSNIIKYQDYIFQKFQLDASSILLVNYVYLLIHIIPVIIVLVYFHSLLRKPKKYY